MKNTKKFLYMLAGIFAMLGGTSCNDDETYDFPGDSMNRVYIKSYTGGDFTFIHTPIQSFSSLDLKFPVYVTGNHSGTIQATVGLDNSLVDAYNMTNNSDFDVLPENALRIENQEMTIPAGEYQSSDSIHIVVNEDILPQLRSEKGYLIPLKLENVKGENAAVSTNMNCTYIPVSVSIKSGMIDDEAVDNDVQGTLVKDRTGWSAYIEESDGVTISGNVSDMFDESTSTEWKLSSEQPYHVVVDLQKSYNVTALRALYLYYGWWEYNSFTNGTKVEYSQDGTDWQDLGTISSTSTKNVILYAPVAMRYLRMEIPVVDSYYYGEVASITIGDFNAILR